MDKEKVKSTVFANAKVASSYPKSKKVIPWSQVFDLIEELDEPEVLIAERTVEKEPDEPVIPQFVGEWIEEMKDDVTLLLVAQETRDGLVRIDVDKWITDNFDTFCRAWPDGYTVEEKKYEVRDENGRLILIKDGMGDIVRAKTEWHASDSKHLTEQEIKDYDERYWAFAEEVTE